MPKYKKRDPEFTAIQFTGSNIREIMDELGPEFSTFHRLDMTDATTFDLTGYGKTTTVHRECWLVVDPGAEAWRVEFPEDFPARYEPVRKAGRPPKDKR